MSETKQETTTKTTKPEPQPCTCSRVWISFPWSDEALRGLPRQQLEFAEVDEIGEDEAGAPVKVWTIQIPCEATTRSTFAPGHDARFKGLMQTALRRGGEAHLTEGGMLVSTDPVSLTAQIAPNLLEAVQHELKVVERKPRTPSKAREALERFKAEQAAGQTPESVEDLTGVQIVVVEPDPFEGLPTLQVPGDEPEVPAYNQNVEAKVGRWIYTGDLSTDGEFTYTNAKGETKTTRSYELMN